MIEKKKAKRSAPTGLFLPCPMNEALHQQSQLGPVAVPIFQGPERFHIDCPACRCRALLARVWAKNMGITPAQCITAGLTMLV